MKWRSVWLALILFLNCAASSAYAQSVTERSGTQAGRVVNPLESRAQQEISKPVLVDVAAQGIKFRIVTDRCERVYNYIYLTGEQGEVSFTIVNNGPSACANVAYRFYMNGFPVESFSIANLAAGQSVEKKIPYSFRSAGRHQVAVEVDYNNSIKETNENNNKVSLEVNVTSDPQDPAYINAKSIGENCGSGGAQLRPSAGT